MRRFGAAVLLFALCGCQDINWIEQHSFAITDPVQYQKAFTTLTTHMAAQNAGTDIYVGPFVVKDGSNEQVAGVVATTVEGKTTCQGLLGDTNSKPFTVDCTQAAAVRSAIQLPSGAGLTITDGGRAALAALPAELDATIDDGAGDTAALKYFLSFSADLKTLTASSQYTFIAKANFFDIGGAVTPQTLDIARIDESSTVDNLHLRIWFATDDPNLLQDAAFLEAPVVVDGRWTGKSWTQGIGPVLDVASYYLDLDVSAEEYRLTFYSLLPYQEPVYYGEDKLVQETVQIKR